MKLSKIDYKSAIFFGIFSLVMYFILGVMQLTIVRNSPEAASLIGYVSPLYALVLTPLIGAITIFVFLFFAILVYNIVAKKFPISWDIKK